jgi:hypothetical protein
VAVRDDDPARMVAGEYSDDPEMFNSIYDFAAGKTTEIDQLVKANLQRLTQQLQSLPLRAGNPANAVQQMLQSLDSQSTSTI